MRNEFAKEKAKADEAKAAEEKVDMTPAAVMGRAKEVFFRVIKESQDLGDNLQQLVDFI